MSPSAEAIRLSVVIVTYNSRREIEATLAALVPQLRDDDELIVVDNGSADGTAAAVREAAPGATVIEPGANLGFAAGCNAGAELASGDVLLLLNPDAVPADGFREAIERPARDGRGWAGWMGLVAAADGRSVNSLGGTLHFTGIAWAGGAGLPRERAPRAPREVAFLSGACLALPLARWRDLGGFPGEFFLYHEDVDLSLRIRLAGGRIGIEPGAVVHHDYDFEKGPEKWRRLEANRWAVLTRDYPGGLLALIAPALLATELALLPVAVASGWGAQKLAAWRLTLAALPRLLRERRRIQARRLMTAGEFARALTPDLDSPYLGAAGRSRLIRAALRGYWRLVLAALRPGRRPAPREAR